MNSSRMSIKTLWRNMGRNASKRGVPLADILTGKSFADENIKAGYATGERRKARRSSAAVKAEHYQKAGIVG